MPTLTRLLAWLFIVAVCVYGAMVALVAFERPVPRVIVVPVDLPKPHK